MSRRNRRNTQKFSQRRLPHCKNLSRASAQFPSLLRGGVRGGVSNEPDKSLLYYFGQGKQEAKEIINLLFYLGVYPTPAPPLRREGNWSPPLTPLLNRSDFYPAIALRSPIADA